MALGGLGTYLSARSAQSMGEAQLEEARRTRDLAMGVAVPSVQELDAMGRQNALAQDTVSYRQKQLSMIYEQMASIDPAIKMAFQQQADIMRGQIPGYLSPLQKQLQIESQNQQNRIAAQMGRGAPSSSAGMMANAIFSQQNAMTMMNAQQQALGVLGNTGAQLMNAQQGMQAGAVNAFGVETAANQATFGMSDELKKRQIQAIIGTPVTPYAGAGSIGGMMIGQGLQGIGNMGMGMGTGMLMNQAMLSQYKSAYPQNTLGPGVSSSGAATVMGMPWGGYRATS